MPTSNDNQDYGKKDNQNQTAETADKTLGKEAATKMNSDDLKGKKVDADPSKESDQPIKE